VTVGGVAATNVVVVDASTVTAKTPVGTAGAKSVSVTAAGGSASKSGAFTYVGAPTVTAVGPATGPASGGTTITITGTNLLSTSSVTVGGIEATDVAVLSATQLTAVTPAGSAGLKSVVVTTSGGTATRPNAFTYIPLPEVTAITPAIGPASGGTTITITGTGLAGAGVTVGGVPATGVVATPTSIAAKTPPGTAGSVDVVITTSGGSVTKTGAFTYVGTPTVDAVTPNLGPTSGGTPITITGTNLLGTTNMTIGGLAATNIVVVDASTVTAKTPAGGVGAKNLVLTSAGGSVTKVGAFTYAPTPTISGVSPSSGPTIGGTTITITGTNLTGATSVTVGGVPATDVTVVSATTVTAVTPAGTAGSRSVAVRTVGGTATRAGGFTYLAAPVVSTVTPSSGPASGGTLITISGTGLTGASVTVGGEPAVNVVATATSIFAKTPAGTAGPADVVVTTAGGSTTKSAGFTYVASLTDDSSGGMGLPTRDRGEDDGSGTATGVAEEEEVFLAGLPVEAVQTMRLVMEGAVEEPACDPAACGITPDGSKPLDELADVDQDGVADLCQLRCGDLNMDGSIDFGDMSLLTGMYGLKPVLGVGDLDDDGDIDVDDLRMLMDRIEPVEAGRGT
ncbi:MAG: IPT/TIG domain-containing protein, partial [Acidobacteria bacterium]|nr:IPT/TIG domain-containing protein [Acidobacteriota bacterium]